MDRTTRCIIFLWSQYRKEMYFYIEKKMFINGSLLLLKRTFYGCLWFENVELTLHTKGIYRRKYLFIFSSKYYEQNIACVMPNTGKYKLLFSSKYQKHKIASVMYALRICLAIVVLEKLSRTDNEWNLYSRCIT